MVLKHFDIGPDRVKSVSPLALITIKVAQKAKEVLVDPVLLLIYKVSILVTVEPSVHVSHFA